MKPSIKSLSIKSLSLKSLWLKSVFSQFYLARLRFVSVHTLIVLLVVQSIIGSALFANPAFAADINPDDPQIKVYEQNNVDVIEIREQNGSGLSHNKFIDYNAIDKNQTINNSSMTFIEKIVFIGYIFKLMTFNLFLIPVNIIHRASPGSGFDIREGNFKK